MISEATPLAEFEFKLFVCLFISELSGKNRDILEKQISDQPPQNKRGEESRHMAINHFMPKMCKFPLSSTD